MDTRPFNLVHERPWVYRTLGFGHAAKWWRDFVTALRAVGYDGILSIEHEDAVMSNRESIEKSVDFLKPIV